MLHKKTRRRFAFGGDVVTGCCVLLWPWHAAGVMVKVIILRTYLTCVFGFYPEIVAFFALCVRTRSRMMGVFVCVAVGHLDHFLSTKSCCYSCGLLDTLPPFPKRWRCCLPFLRCRATGCVTAGPQKPTCVYRA